MNGSDAKPEITLILGAGNISMGDEGFGVHVVRRLKSTDLPPNVRTMEGGVGGFDLLGSLEGISKLIIVDIMMTDKPAGELVFFKHGKENLEPGKRVVSFHQVGIQELLQIGELIGHKPEVFFLVTAPQTLDWSFELSPQVQAAAVKAAEMLREIALDDFRNLETTASSRGF